MTRSGEDEVDDELVERLRAKYSHMALEASRQIADNSCATVVAAASNENIADGPTSGSQARICSLCEGSGELKYDYNFRSMTKQCTQCDGEGLLNTKKQLENKDGKVSKQRTRTGGAARVMSHKQRERVDALKSQISRLEQKIGDLEAEKVLHESSRQSDTDSERTVSLLKDLTVALEKSLATLYRCKRDREDHLSYYDNMEQPVQEEPQA